MVEQVVERRLDVLFGRQSRGDDRAVQQILRARFVRIVEHPHVGEEVRFGVAEVRAGSAVG